MRTRSRYSLNRLSRFAYTYTRVQCARVWPVCPRSRWSTFGVWKIFQIFLQTSNFPALPLRFVIGKDDNCSVIFQITVVR